MGWAEVARIATSAAVVIALLFLIRAVGTLIEMVSTLTGLTWNLIRLITGDDHSADDQHHQADDHPEP